MIELLITYSLLGLGTWIWVFVAFVAGLANLGRVPMLSILIALFGGRVLETHDPGNVLTPFPYFMASLAVLMAIVAHIAGLAASSALGWRRRH